MSEHERPLSPHLQVYRPQMTSVLSIMHRFTGFGLALGLLVVTWWLTAAAMGPDQFLQFNECMSSFIGKAFLFGWLWALAYHMLNGVRHLFWDAGYLLEIKSAERAGWAVVIGSLLLAFGVFAAGFVSLIEPAAQAAQP